MHRGERVNGRNGSNGSWFATSWLAPAKDLLFAVVTNRGGDGAIAALDTVFQALIQTYAQ